MKRVIILIGVILLLVLVWTQWLDDSVPSVRIIDNMSTQLRGGSAVTDELSDLAVPAQDQASIHSETARMGADYFHTGKRLSGFGNTIPGELLATGTVPEHVERAGRLFDNRCATCHGEDGLGQGTMALMEGYPTVPSFKDQKYERMTLGRIFSSISNGQGNMPAFRQQMTALEMWQLSLKVRQFSQKK
jgi:mono/diheme cytochrome c family protein